MVRNKKFKYYTDKTMKKLKGIIDFDRVQCVIMIDDADESALIAGNQGFQLDEQDIKRFRIEIIGCKKQFIFKVPSSNTLREWMTALYANWNASKSFNLVN